MRQSQIKSSSPVPKEGYLFNFEVPGPDMVPFLTVLDPYGDNVLSTRVRRAILGGPSDSSHETIGIRHDTGEIVRVGIILHEGGFCRGTVGVTFTSFPQKRIVLPEAHRSQNRLRELLRKKRPFSMTLDSRDLFRFIDHWASYDDVQARLVVDLKFDNENLQVSADDWRTVTPWKLMPEEETRS